METKPGGSYVDGRVVGACNGVADVVTGTAVVVVACEFGSLDVMKVDTSGGCLVGEGGLDIGGDG